MKAAGDEIGILRRTVYHSARTPALKARLKVLDLRYAHALWHLFVLAGSVCHVVAVATLL